jgi:hypothetical protein
MANKIVLILGNGFTMDFLRSVERTSEIDVRNLFARGADVPWPVDGQKGFLSYKFCPSLWILGARPYVDVDLALELIEGVLTCANVSPNMVVSKPNVYIDAYRELTVYIRHLFTHYNYLVNDETIRQCTWSWVSWFERQVADPSVDKITVISYNYDVWLERCLRIKNIPFDVILDPTRHASNKIRIIKPHGSISFCHKDKLDRDAFRIRYDKPELIEGVASDFSVEYDDLSANYLVHAIIPPAGDSNRLGPTWAREMRTLATSAASELSAEDLLLICGVSYWHVDRAEIDELLTACASELDVIQINPDPSRAFNAVLTSLFQNFIHYPSSTNLV